MTDYKDPADIEELKLIIEQMNTLTTTSETIHFINTYLPGWIISILSDYSADYPHLSNNWSMVCDKINIEPKKIILVDQIMNDPEYTLLAHLCEYITKNGYVVRRKEEFISCEKCGKAIPSEGLYEYMKKALPDKVPKKWSSTCLNC